MADLYLKALESERKSLWAACRLKGLAKDSPERLRIVQIDGQLSEAPLLYWSDLQVADLDGPLLGHSMFTLTPHRDGTL